MGCAVCRDALSNRRVRPGRSRHPHDVGSFSSDLAGQLLALGQSQPVLGEALGKGFAEEILVVDFQVGGASATASRLVRTLAPPN